MNPTLACWLACPDIVFIEIARDVGFGTLVMDVEHGTFALGDLDKLIPFAAALGMRVLVKVDGPRAEPIQQALDFGAHGVIIPHVLGVDHARTICSAAKYPTLGTRSYAGARTVRYGSPADDYFEQDNLKTKCYPMVESKEALADVEAIVALPTVDGVFIGPSDLSLSRGRGRYRFADADRADMQRVVDACRAAGKEWLMATWRKDEQEFAGDRGASVRVVVEQQAAMYTGLAQVFSSLQKPA